MPHYFFDTSALVKHYHTELGSPRVDQILGESGSDYSIARLTLTEVPSVFAKKVRTGEIAGADFDRLRLRFYADVRNRIESLMALRKKPMAARALIDRSTLAKGWRMVPVIR